MEKLPMCRICLVKNGRMYVVVNKNLHELYERLTDNPFVTKDSRPMLTCFFCCSKLKQCYRFLRKCLEAEELFAQMMNEDYERDPSVNAKHFGLIISPVMHISVVDAGQTVSVAVKQELPDACESADIAEPVVKHETDDLELKSENGHYSEDAPHQSGEQVMEIKNEVEDEQEPIGSPDAAKIKLETQEINLEGVIKDEEEKIENNQKISFVIQKHKKIQNRTSKTGTKFKEPFSNITPGVTNSVNNTSTVICCSTKNDLSEISNEGSDSNDIDGQRKVSVEEKLFNCDLCECSFTRNNHLISHIRTHTGEKPFTCDLCKRSFTDKSKLTRHIRCHTRGYKCDICHRSFSRNSRLVNHIRVHTGEKPYKCDICQRSFNQSGHLTIHLRVHNSEKLFKCDLCPNSYHDKSNLVRHRVIHTGEMPFKCEACEKRFNFKASLVKHTNMHHGTKDIFTCDVCKRNFNHRSSLTTHIRVHYNNTSFKCEFCERCFSRNVDLTKHLRCHTGEKPFKCDICQRGFIQQDHLKRHLLVHSGERPFKCKTCQLSFSRKCHLTRHYGRMIHRARIARKGHNDSRTKKATEGTQMSIVRAK